MTGDRLGRIQARAEAHVAAGAFSGVEWRIDLGDRVWSEGRAGQSDALEGTAMPDVPIYRIYSMTKPIVSAVAVMLFEEGKIRLSDPVADFLPDFASPDVLGDDGKTAPANKPILIEHLLTHRSGLSYGFLPDCPVGARYRDDTFFGRTGSLADFVSQIASHPLAFEPGRKWRYSVATDVMGRVLEVVEGKPLQDILAARVFAPLGLKDTGYMVPEGERHRIMTMFGQADLDRLLDYPDGPQELHPVTIKSGYPADDPGFARGGHGLFSTVPDYMAIARFLATGKSADGDPLLSRKGAQALWTNRLPEAQYPMMLGPLALLGYGWGLAGRVMAKPGEGLGLSSALECGWAGAASTYFWIDPVEDMIGVVMSQYLGSKIPLGDDIRNAAYQALE